MTKKHILCLIIAFSLPLTLAFAAMPSLSVSGNGDGDNVLISINGGEGNSPVSLYFLSSADGTLHSQVLGTTNQTGSFSGTISTRGVGITNTTPVYVMVNGYNSNSLTWPYTNNSASAQQITFSQASPVVQVGQSGTVTISGGNGSYYLSSNSNSQAISAALSGNTLTFSGVGSGSSNISICSVTGGLCGLITISTNGVNTTPNNGILSLNPSAITLGMNQNGSIQLLGGSAPYTISTISGETIHYSFSGDLLTVSGATLGSRSVRVCSSNATCMNLSITVTGTQSPTLALNPASLMINLGQSGTVQIIGGTSPYNISSVTGNTLTTSISGSVLTVQGINVGVTSLTVCSSNGICNPLTITVSNGTPSSNQAFSLPIAINQNLKIMLSGGNSSAYYLQSGTSNTVAAVLYNNILTITGKTYGSSDVIVCQNGNGSCMTFTIVVNQASDPVTGTGGPYTFSHDLWFGQTDNDVVELQKYLIGENYLNSEATGYFGSLTHEAVRKFQSANNISATGYVGTLTRGALNN